jgi:hypothetical protein
MQELQKAVEVLIARHALNARRLNLKGRSLRFLVDCSSKGFAALRALYPNIAVSVNVTNREIILNG